MGGEGVIIDSGMTQPAEVRETQSVRCASDILTFQRVAMFARKLQFDPTEPRLTNPVLSDTYGTFSVFVNSPFLSAETLKSRG